MTVPRGWINVVDWQEGKRETRFEKVEMSNTVKTDTREWQISNSLSSSECENVCVKC